MSHGKSAGWTVSTAHKGQSAAARRDLPSWFFLENSAWNTAYHRGVTQLNCDVRRRFAFRRAGTQTSQASRSRVSLRTKSYPPKTRLDGIPKRGHAEHRTRFSQKQNHVSNSFQRMVT